MAAQEQHSLGVSALRARSLSEETVRVHPSPATSAAGPLQLSRHVSQDCAALCEADPAGLMSQLIASQLPGPSETRVQEAGGVPAVQQGTSVSGLTANLSDPGALASFLQTGECCLPKHHIPAAVLLEQP